MKIYKYIVDGLAPNRINTLNRTLKVVKEVNGFKYDPDTQILYVRSEKSQEQSIRMALAFCNAKLRVRM